MHPLITPPLPDDNPYIWKSKKPEGFIFIVVGLFALLVFLLLFIWYAIQVFLSVRAAKSTVHHYESKSFDDTDSFMSASSSSSKSDIILPLDVTFPVPFAEGGNSGNEETADSKDQASRIQEPTPSILALPDFFAERKDTFEELKPVHITALRSAGKTKRKPTPSMHLDALLYGSLKQSPDYKKESRDV
ncbi:hypothetical protein ACO0QE_001173 [Hanseniaspora vineae]